jgi:ABC-2 type transport system ATP-binding protein
MSNHMLETRGVVKRYDQYTALNQVSITIPKGSIFGLLGPNGAGKTSLIRIITQITAADEGQVFFDGQPLHSQHIQQIGYMPEERGLYRKMKVGEQLMYLAQLRGLSEADAKKRLKYWFEKLDIVSWWKKNIEELSKGMQQKVQFIATVLHQPPLLILDEPFSGLDPVNEAVIRDEILELRKQGSTIIFSTHRMETVEELCDDIALINRSEKILEGRKNDIKNAFKRNVFIADTSGELATNEYFTIEKSARLDAHTHRHYLRLQGQDSNALVAAIIQQTHLLAFREDLPGMHEIFVTAVSQQKKQ